MALARIRASTAADERESRAALSYRNDESELITHDREWRAVGHSLGRSDVPQTQIQRRVDELAALESSLASCLRAVDEGEMTPEQALAILRGSKR